VSLLLNLSNFTVRIYWCTSITSFEKLPWEVRQAREIFEAHQKWTMPNSEVRNRLKIISLMCPDTAGKILNANEED
jgi:hypothetical protein